MSDVSAMGCTDVANKARAIRAGRGLGMERGTVRRPSGFGRGVAAVVSTVALSLGGEVSGAHAAPKGGPTSNASVIPGWPGGAAVYAGRYRLTASGDANFAQSGMLTIFTRTVLHQPKPQMSGILSLYTTDGTNVLYLTHFVHAGTMRSAQVNLGIYTGPLIGRFAVASHQGAALVATFVPLEGAPVPLRFTQISANPHP